MIMGRNVTHGSRRTDEIWHFLKFRDIKILGFITVWALGNVVFGQVAKTEDPAILKGYGATKWGQSMETVTQVLPDGEVRTGDDFTFYRVMGKGQIVDTEYKVSRRSTVVGGGSICAGTSSCRGPG